MSILYWAAGAFIHTNTLVIKTFSPVFIDMLKGKGLFHVPDCWKKSCYIVFERVTCPRLFQLLRYKIPFVECRTIWASRKKIRKNQKFNYLWCVCRLCKLSLVASRARKRKKIREIKFRNYWRSKIEPHRLMTLGAWLRQYTDNKNNSKQEWTVHCSMLIHGNIA